MRQFLFAPLALLCLLALPATAQESRPFTQGPVIQVTDVRVMDGQFDNYMRYLQSTYKPLMEAQKKAGIIVDYGVYSRRPRSTQDGNMYLTVVYPNMAAFDGLDDRVEPISRKISGLTREQAAKAGVERASMRTILGSELIRTLELK